MYEHTQRMVMETRCFLHGKSHAYRQQAQQQYDADTDTVGRDAKRWAAFSKALVQKLRDEVRVIQ